MHGEHVDLRDEFKRYLKKSKHLAEHLSMKSKFMSHHHIQVMCRSSNHSQKSITENILRFETSLVEAKKK